MKRRARKGKAIRAGYRAVYGPIKAPFKRAQYSMLDAFEQGKANRDYKKKHGKAAYKKAKREDKAAKRYYDRKHYG